MDEPTPARSPEEIQALVQNTPSARVLDVRTPESRAEGNRIDGSELLPVNGELSRGEMDVLLEQGLPSDTPIVFVCNSGGKCGRAAEYLRGQGYDAYSVDGGMTGWVEAGLPVEP